MVVVLHKGILRKRKRGANKITRWVKRTFILYELHGKTMLRYFESPHVYKGELSMSDVYHVARSTATSNIFHLQAKSYS